MQSRERLHSNQLDNLIQSGLMSVQIALIPIYVEIGIMHMVHLRKLFVCEQHVAPIPPITIVFSG